MIGRLLVACVLVLVAGCGVRPVERVGESVLRGFGAAPGTESVSAEEALERMADLSAITPENEYFIGRSVSAKLLSRYPLVDDEVLTKYVNKVGQSAVAFSNRPETYGGYHFGVLDTEDFNALAAPGGFIFISKGLLKILPNEDALAAVLAHEITHVTERHALQRISGSDLASAFTAAGVVAGALSCNEAVAGASVVLATVTDRIIAVLLEKGFSREQEFEADAGAVRILGQVGYQRGALLEALHRLDGVQINRSSGWFKTHPSNTERRAALAGKISGPAVDTEGRERREERFERFVAPIKS